MFQSFLVLKNINNYIYCFAVVPLFVLLFSAMSVRGESKEVIVVNGSCVFSFSTEEFDLSVPDFADENRVHLVVDEYPVFQHIDGLKKYVESNLSYPELAIANQIEGVVLVNFIVEKDGSISNQRILKAIGYGCEEEVLKVFENFPKAKPGKIAHQPVRVSITLPVRFKLK